MDALTNESTCGCEDFNVTRRTVLRGAAGIAGAGMTTKVFGDVFTQVAYGAPSATGNVLVVLSLRGGADGMSMVVPHGDNHYYPARPKISVPRGQLLARDDMFGLHPSLQPLMPLWNSGKFGVVHAVGLPAPNRSHFAAMEEIEDADPGSSERRGWINRMAGLIGGGDASEAVGLGSGSMMGSLYGKAPSMSLDNLRDLKLPSDGTNVENQTRRSLQTAWTGANTPLGEGARAALDVSKRLGSLSNPKPPANGAHYPSGRLGESMAETARLIRAGVGVRVVTVDAGNWDMHNNLGTPQLGEMKLRLDELAGVLAAFFKDLGTAANRVTLVTVSEFGRRVTENGNYGLDHGYGNCMLLLGAGVRGGRYVANWPGLGPSALEDGDLQVTTDYRDVLGEVVRSRFPGISLPALFPGYTTKSVGIAA